MAPAEHVERQVAVAVVIAVEEPPLLLAVHRIVGRIEIKDDLVRCSLLGLQEQVDEQPLDGHRIVTDLVIARRLQAAQLQPVERDLPATARNPRGAQRACRALPASDRGAARRGR